MSLSVAEAKSAFTVATIDHTGSEPIKLTHFVIRRFPLSSNAYHSLDVAKKLLSTDFSFTVWTIAFFEKQHNEIFVHTNFVDEFSKSSRDHTSYNDSEKIFMCSLKTVGLYIHFLQDLILSKVHLFLH